MRGARDERTEAGREVCRLIRRQTATAHVPILIVSARADEVDRVLGLEMGADEHVVTPQCVPRKSW